MNLKIVFLASFLIILNLPVLAIEPEWFLKLQKIKVFQSTRQEVEKTFNYPEPEIISNSNTARKEISNWGEKVEYKTKDGYLETLYSTGKCTTNKSGFGYDIGAEIVVELHFYPFMEIAYSEFKFDLNQFKSEAVLDVVNTYALNNKILGIGLTINNKKLSKIEYYPSEKQEEYSCDNFRK